MRILLTLFRINFMSFKTKTKYLLGPFF